jgi:3'-5' exoribonuclease
VKSPNIADFLPGQNTTGIFLVAAKEVRPKKSGDPYLSLTLADRTGEVDAKMWDNVEGVMDTFNRNDFVRVTGVPNLYNNRLQFTVHKLARVSESDLEMGDFFPASRRDRDGMMKELRGIIASVGNPHLRALLEAIFSDAALAEKYKTAPAAKSIHHAWLGGLIEHVLALCALCRSVAPHYPQVDVDLLLTGAILHDIGKVDELTYQRGFGYSDDGQMIGHIVQGLRIVDEAARHIPELPAKLKTLVDHMILSHHGELEFGSPKVPLFPEALMLHFLDNLDSKMEAMRAGANKDNFSEGAWSGWVPSLERPVLKKDRYLEGAPPPAARPPAEAQQRKVRPESRQPETPSLFGEKLAGALDFDPDGK